MRLHNTKLDYARLSHNLAISYKCHNSKSNYTKVSDLSKIGVYTNNTKNRTLLDKQNITRLDKTRQQKNSGIKNGGILGNKLSMNYLTLIAVTLLASLVLASPVLGSFKVITTIHNVNSYTGKYKITVTLDNKEHKTIKPNLGKDANYQDEPDLSYTFTFKHSPVSFKTCIDGPDLTKCIKSKNSPDKRPEKVSFTLPS